MFETVIDNKTVVFEALQLYYAQNAEIFLVFKIQFSGFASFSFILVGRCYNCEKQELRGE